MSELTRRKTKNAKRIVWFCVTGIVLTLVAFAVVVREIGIEDQLKAQAAFDPCVSLSEAVANQNRERIPPLTRECKEFLSGLGPLVTIKLSCAIIEKARYVCPAPGTEQRRGAQRGEVPLGPALTGIPPTGPAPFKGGGQQPKPGREPGVQGPGGTEKQGARKPRQPKPSEPQTQPSPQPSSSGLTSPTPLLPAEPGNSGQTPAAEKSVGVHACVDLILSACVKTDSPRLSP